jgi:hypothetical protein
LTVESTGCAPLEKCAILTSAFQQSPASIPIVTITVPIPQSLSRCSAFPYATFTRSSPDGGLASP